MKNSKVKNTETLVAIKSYNFKKHFEKNRTHSESGITLITLVITIIVLIILSGISINMISGQDGILIKTSQAKNATNFAKAEEALQLSYLAAIGNDMNFDDEKFMSEARNAGVDLLPDSKIATNTSYIVIVDGEKHQVIVTNNGVEISKTVISDDDTIIEDITFSTEWGTIDIVWLDTKNNIISEPLEPANYLSYQGKSMTPVVYDTTSNVFNDASSTDKGVWYNYSSENTGNDLTKGYQWANAKTENESYFVWIPRYAYRITYYAGSTTNADGTVTPTGDPTGYYDGYGQWKASDKKIRVTLDDGIETVKVGDLKYIVHPAFMKDDDKTGLEDYARGGWSEDLAGFWCAKYEASLNSSNQLQFIPNVASKRLQAIGTQYATAINATYGYSDLTENPDGVTSYMNSHQMKNSEWGAVAYLAHSKYGLNGKEIAINNSSTYITGNSGGSATASSASGITNAYNTVNGVKASTTQNVYGIYDLSGGAWEYVAVFNSKDTNDHFLSYGWSSITKKVPGINESTDSKTKLTSAVSTKYATKYNNQTLGNYGNYLIHNFGKVGDATKEVNKGGIKSLSNTSAIYNWNNDYPILILPSRPFCLRGGNYNIGSSAGIFYSGNASGGVNSIRSFRTILVL